MDRHGVGLTVEEAKQIAGFLGRDPTVVEMYIFNSEWSEHCSYKSSKVHLRYFGETTTDEMRKDMLAGIGENAGVVDIGDGWAVTFKVESHNHPSYVEPYQGAATGVGGIVRDIMAMGARPVAVMDQLRFGAADAPDTRRVLDGVVRGIGGYGNSLGLPNIGGETIFDPCYAGNPLVNALCVGVLKKEDLHLAFASGAGNKIILFGARTGLDGIGGVSVLASDTFGGDEDGAGRKKLPSVQVGDPFTEKVLIECCLELYAAHLVVGIQDLGGAGLSCATSELASAGDGGMHCELDLVPLRDYTMSPEEILMSESQERMMAICEPDDVERFMEICAKWDVQATVVGELIEGNRLYIDWHGQRIVDVDRAAPGGPRHLELDRLGALGDRRQRLARTGRAGERAVEMPGEIGRQFGRRAALAQGGEGPLVEHRHVGVRQPLDGLADRHRQPLDRVTRRPPAQVLTGDGGQGAGLDPVGVAPDRFDVRRQLLGARQAEHSVEILAVQLVHARVVQVLHHPARPVHPGGHDGGLDVLGPVGGAGRVGQPPAVHLDGEEQAPRRAGLDGVEHRAPHVLLGHLQAVEPAQILRRRLEECPLHTVVVGRERAGERGHRIEPQRMQQLGPQVRVAVGLQPDPRRVMHRTRTVVCRFSKDLKVRRIGRCRNLRRTGGPHRARGQTAAAVSDSISCWMASIDAKVDLRRASSGNSTSNSSSKASMTFTVACDVSPCWYRSAPGDNAETSALMRPCWASTSRIRSWVCSIDLPLPRFGLAN